MNNISLIVHEYGELYADAVSICRFNWDEPGMLEYVSSYVTYYEGYGNVTGYTKMTRESEWMDVYGNIIHEHYEELDSFGTLINSYDSYYDIYGNMITYQDDGEVIDAVDCYYPGLDDENDNTIENNQLVYDVAQQLSPIWILMVDLDFDAINEAIAFLDFDHSGWYATVGR